MRLRTANHNRKRLHRRAVLAQARAFDLGQIAKGRDRSSSGFVRRWRKRNRPLVRRMLLVLDTPDRQWFRLSGLPDLPHGR